MMRDDAAIGAANDAASDAANDYRRAGLPFPLQKAGLGCLSRCLRHRAGLPFSLCGRKVRQRAESVAKFVRLP